MRTALVVASALLLAACYAPTVPGGVPCSAACPGTQVCIDQVCREAGYVHDAAPDDVPPAPCPGGTHDEDGDLLADACDPCPHLAGTDVDADHDGVGDACDPEPAMPRQRWRMFDPFTELTALWDGWDPAQVAGDQLRIDGDGYGELATTTGSLRIEVGGTILAVRPASVHAFVIELGVVNNGERYHYVELWDDGRSGDVAITKADGDQYVSIATTPYDEIPVGPWSMRVDESVAQQRITLDTRLGGLPMPRLEASTATRPRLAAGPHLWVGVTNLDLTLSYFAVIETLP